jgi:GNAT superfamily N-acetyltransferase
LITGTKTEFGDLRDVEILEYRDAQGLLHGVVEVERSHSTPDHPWRLFIMVDPAMRRHGIATQLMRRAVKQWEIDFQEQTYTRDGAKFFRNFLRPSPKEPTPQKRKRGCCDE